VSDPIATFTRWCYLNASLCGLDAVCGNYKNAALSLTMAVISLLIVEYECGRDNLE
jgi:hypothetical protein